MILTAVQDVNVVRDGWDWLFGVAGVAGALVGAIAILFAVAAQRTASKARRAVGAERRRQFELEELRGILERVEGGLLETPHYYQQIYAQLQHRIMLLPENALPAWRTLIDEMQRERRLPPAQQTYGQSHPPPSPETLMFHLDLAIKQRVNAVDD